MKARIILLVVVTLGLIAYGFYRYQASRRPYEWSGTVEARTMDIGSRVGGRVQEVLAREGSSVDAGQPLVVLEPGDLPAQRLQAQGQLEQAEAGLEKVASKSVPTQRRAEIEGAQARLQAEEIALEKAKLDNERMEKLFAAGAATVADRDNASITFRNTTAQVTALKAQVDQLLHGTPQDVKTAQGQVDAARGRLQQIEVNIDELTIRAPRASKVESLDLRPGDILGPNATAAKLLEPGELYLRIYVPETQLGHIRLGQEVPIYVDSFPDKAFQGVVEYIAHEGEYTPRNLQTADERADQVFASRVRLLTGMDVLRAGMAAFIQVPR
jgi:HlyD family secretion protein